MHNLMSSVQKSQEKQNKKLVILNNLHTFAANF